MSELKTQILQTLTRIHEEQEAQQEIIQGLQRRVDSLEGELTTAKQLQSHLEEGLNTLALLSEELQKASGSSFRRRG